MRREGKSISSQVLVTEALYVASSSGVACQHEADFYKHCVDTGQIVKHANSFILVPKCTAIEK